MTGPEAVDRWPDYQDPTRSPENYGLNETEFLESTGISIEGMHVAYLNEVQKQPEMAVDNWDHLLSSNDTGKIDALITFLETIIPENMQGGKANFITNMRAIRDEIPSGGLYEIRDPAKTDTIHTYTVLKHHIENLEAADRWPDYRDDGADALDRALKPYRDLTESPGFKEAMDTDDNEDAFDEAVEKLTPEV